MDLITFIILLAVSGVITFMIMHFIDKDVNKAASIELAEWCTLGFEKGDLIVATSSIILDHARGRYIGLDGKNFVILEGTSGVYAYSPHSWNFEKSLLPEPTEIHLH